MPIPPSSLAPYLLPPIFTLSLVAFKLVPRAGVPNRAVNLLSCSLSCSLGLIALSHHGMIILKLHLHKRVFMLTKMTGTFKNLMASAALLYGKWEHSRQRSSDSMKREVHEA